jgi:hypothetical protein
LCSSPLFFVVLQLPTIDENCVAVKTFHVYDVPVPLEYGFQLFVRSLTKTIALDVKLTDSVAELKLKVFEKDGIPKSLQRLLFGGTELEDSQTVQFYQLQSHSSLSLSLRIRGGMDEQTPYRQRRKHVKLDRPKEPDICLQDSDGSFSAIAFDPISHMVLDQRAGNPSSSSDDVPDAHVVHNPEFDLATGKGACAGAGDDPPTATSLIPGTSESGDFMLTTGILTDKNQEDSDEEFGCEPHCECLGCCVDRYDGLAGEPPSRKVDGFGVFTSETFPILSTESLPPSEAFKRKRNGLNSEWYVRMEGKESKLLERKLSEAPQLRARASFTSTRTRGPPQCFFCEEQSNLMCDDCAPGGLFLCTGHDIEQHGLTSIHNRSSFHESTHGFVPISMPDRHFRCSHCSACLSPLIPSSSSVNRVFDVTLFTHNSGVVHVKVTVVQCSNVDCAFLSGTTAAEFNCTPCADGLTWYENSLLHNHSNLNRYSGSSIPLQARAGALEASCMQRGHKPFSSVDYMKYTEASRLDAAFEDERLRCHVGDVAEISTLQLDSCPGCASEQRYLHGDGCLKIRCLRSSSTPHGAPLVQSVFGCPKFMSGVGLVDHEWDRWRVWRSQKEEIKKGKKGSSTFTFMLSLVFRCHHENE